MCGDTSLSFLQLEGKRQTEADRLKGVGGGVIKREIQDAKRGAWGHIDETYIRTKDGLTRHLPA